MMFYDNVVDGIRLVIFCLSIRTDGLSFFWECLGVTYFLFTTIVFFTYISTRVTGDSDIFSLCENVLK